jgi:hypothetical protein
MLVKNMSLEEKFNYFTSKIPTKSGCLLWLGGQFSQGYGGLYFNGKTYYAHRVAFFLKYGHVPKNLGTHSCNIKLCVNWEHIIDNSYSQNTKNAYKDGLIKNQIGENNNRAILTWKQVREIRCIYTGVRGQQTQLAKIYGTDRANICNIVNNHRWIEKAVDDFLVQENPH